MTELLRREALFWRDAWRASPTHVVLGWLLVLGSAAASLASVLATAHLIGALTGGAPAATTQRWLLAAVAGFAAVPVCNALLGWLGSSHQARMTAAQLDRLGALADAPHGTAHLEDPATSGELTALTSDLRSQFGLTATHQGWIALGVRAQGVAALVVVAGWSVLVAVLLLVAQLAFGQLFTAYIQTVQRDLLEAESGERRMAGYLHGLLLDRSAGKEVRLFGLTEHLLDAHATVWTAAQRGVEARRAAAMRPSLLGSALVLLATAAATGWAAHGAWVGTVSTTTLVAVVQALAGLSALGPLGDLSVSAARARLYAGRLTDLEAQAGPPAVVAPRAGGGAAALSLRGVTFTYPGAAAPTLRDLSLEVPAGQSMAVVGVNGVGKSTLIKLVAGLHRPDAGTVRVGGADPGTDDAARQRVSVIFQDFARYPLGLRENVLLGAPAARAAGGEAAAEATRRALATAASTSLLQRVGGLEVPLDPELAGGTDLSGGQWQRVALARALAAVDEGAGVLVLDEPTAALDVRVEADLFEQLLRSAGQVTTVLVSHRLSSVRRADRIVVLGPGGVVEDGTHDELLAAGGEYARMFTLQASRFAGDGPDDGPHPDQEAPGAR